MTCRIVFKEGAVEERDKGCFDYEADARMCSLTSSGDAHDFKLAEDLSKNSKFYCLTCKSTAEDMERLCAPALL